MKSKRVSLVIATFRREAMLRDTISSVMSMTVPAEVSVEVIIVDNDPEAGARKAMPELERMVVPPFQLRYVHEVRTGLSHARNRGIQESGGEVIGFLDDDVFVCREWLESVLGCFERTGADCVGGRTLVHWESPPDPVLGVCATKLLAVDMGSSDCEVKGQQLPGGGNAAFLRQVFDRGLRFATELGRVGKVLLSGEDTDLLLRLRRAGGRIWYCASASIQHRTGGERLTCEYVVRQKYWFGVSYAVIDRKALGAAQQICLAFARLCKLIGGSLPKLGLARLRGDRPHELLARCSAATQLGYVRAALSPPRISVPGLSPQSSAAIAATPQA